MICPNCGQRWAPVSNDNEKHEKEFQSDEKKVCGCEDCQQLKLLKQGRFKISVSL